MLAVESAWPTPQSRDHRDGRIGEATAESNTRPLNEFVVSMWPTPGANVSNDGETLEAWQARRELNLAKGYNGNGQGTPLTIASIAFPSSPLDPATSTPGDESSPADPTSPPLWPSPNSRGGTGYMSGSNRDTWRPTLESMAQGYVPVLHQGRPEKKANGKQLNADFVEWLMGLPPGLTACELSVTEFARYRRRMRSALSTLLSRSPELAE